MARSWPWAKWLGPLLSIIGATAGIVHAQEPAATQPGKPSATQPAEPAVAPQAYRIQPNNMLVYWVRITSRSSQNPSLMEKIDRRELAVFNVDEDGSLVVYMGAPKDSKPGTLLTAAPSAQPIRGREHRPVMPPAAETKPDKPQPVEMTWTKHVLGKSFTRNEDGTVSFEPGTQAVAYPVLPLPPADVKEKERFEVSLPDIAAGADKTLQLAGLWKASAEKFAVEARLEPKIVPGVPFVPELAIFSYEVPREPMAVTQIHESRKLPAEQPAQAGEASTGEHGRSAPAGRGPRGVAAGQRPAQPTTPMINVLVTLEKTVPLTAEQHRAMVAHVSGQTGGEAQKAQAEKEAAPSPEVQDVIQQMQGWNETTKDQLQKLPGQ